MQNVPLLNYHITACAADFVCRGAVAIPSFRRFSDFINDSSAVFLTLGAATAETWDGTPLPIAAPQTSVVLNKQNLVAVLLARDAPPPRTDPTQVVPKAPVAVRLLASPLFIEGQWNLARGVDWQRAMTVLRDDFFIVTHANVDYLGANRRIEQDLPVVCVKRSSIGVFQISNPSEGE